MTGIRLDLIGRYLRPHRKKLLLGALTLVFVNILSGKLLFDKATESLVDYREFLGDSIPIMASGGVMDVDSFKRKIEADATLVQVYTGMIYQGPSLIPKLLSISNKD